MKPVLYVNRENALPRFLHREYLHAGNMSNEFGSENICQRQREPLPHTRCYLHSILVSTRHCGAAVEPVTPVQVACDCAPLAFEVVCAGITVGTSKVQTLIAVFGAKCEDVPVKKHIGLEA